MSILASRAVAETTQASPRNWSAAGHLALPNGLGLDHLEGAQRIRTGVGPNEFTASEDRDPWVGTPWHKSIPARLEAIPN